LPSRTRFIADSGASSLTMLLASPRDKENPSSLDGLVDSIRHHTVGRR
jgi:hypothetical protein